MVCLHKTLGKNVQYRTRNRYPTFITRYKWALNACYSPPRGAAVLAVAAAAGVILEGVGVVVVPFKTGAAVMLVAAVPTSMELWLTCSCPELLLLWACDWRGYSEGMDWLALGLLESAWGGGRGSGAGAEVDKWGDSVAGAIWAWEVSDGVWRTQSGSRYMVRSIRRPKSGRGTRHSFWCLYMARKLSPTLFQLQWQKMW